MRHKFSIFNFQFSIKSQSGQVIVILLLLTLVALSIGLAVTQRSVTDVSTSTQTEQASRALSAAEAGIQKALDGMNSGQIPLDNSSSANVDASAWLPAPNTDAGVEYPPIGRETTAQFWFTDPDLSGPAVPYSGDRFDLYFGNEGTLDNPAVEVEIVVLAGTNFYSKTYFFDSDPARVTTNNFTYVSGCGSVPLAKGILGDGHKFFCKQTIGPRGPVTYKPDSGNTEVSCTLPNCKLILARVRLLYSNENHKIAIAPSPGASLPRQAQIYNSTGISGQSQKQIQAFRVRDVVPPWFNFAIFSINEIDKR